jgi:hypothetical protein
VFPLYAVVRRRIVQPNFHGVGVEFVDLDEARRKELGRFIRSERTSETDLELPAAVDPK